MSSLEEIIEVEREGYIHRIEYFTEGSQSGLVTSQRYSFYNKGEVVWSKRFKIDVTFRDMTIDFMCSSAYKPKRRHP